MSSIFFPLCVVSVVTLIMIGSSTAAFPRICGNRYYDTTCDSYKKAYGCNPAYMQTNCRLACDQCEPGDIMPAKVTSNCYDIYQSWSCTGWGDTIGCGTVNMVKNCQRSCNLCEDQQTKVVTTAPVVETTTGASAD